MNREEAIRAMLDGKRVTCNAEDSYCYYDDSKSRPFRYVVLCDGHNEEMALIWSEEKWELYEEPKPKKRYMTREEVLGFVCNTPGIVIRYQEGRWEYPGEWSYIDIKDYEYAYIDKSGNIGKPHKFMVDEY